MLKILVISKLPKFQKAIMIFFTRNISYHYSYEINYIIIILYATLKYNFYLFIILIRLMIMKKVI